MNIFRLFTFLTLLCYTHALHAAMPVGKQGSQAKVQQFINHKDWSFVENKGQIATPNPQKGENGYDFHPEIKYYGHQGGVYLYCKPDMISFVFTKTENAPDQISEATGQRVETQCLRLNHASAMAHLPQDAFNASLQKTITTSRTDLVLLNSNPNAEIVASDQQEYYENFYLAYTPEEGITNVHTYKTITYKSIYPNIDMVLKVIPSSAKASAGEEGMEYSFIIHPGGKVSDIQLQWNGTEAKKALANGGFKFSNALGTLTESAPKSFADGKLVPSRFEKNGFKVGNYNKGKDLVIDPFLQWATFFGGSGNDNPDGIAVDNVGNIITGGYTESSGLATSGAFRTQSGFGIGILAQFNNSLSKLNWCTYYAGVIQGVATDTSGNIYIDGEAFSSSGIATSGAYKTSLPTTSGVSAFLAKFTSTGTRTWGTYYGGSQSTDATSIYCTNHGNILMAGWTTSYSNGIATSGAYQTGFNSGTKATIGENDFVAKFSSSGSLLWGTYCGGNNLTQQPSYVCSDTSENTFISGSTVSFTLATSGAFQTSFLGTVSGANAPTNAYVVKLSPTCKCLWATYFGGDNGETTSGISADYTGNVYIDGLSNSSGLASSGAYQTSNTGEDIFIAKFSSTGSRMWSTYMGLNLQQYCYGIVIDNLNGIFVLEGASSILPGTNNGGFQTNGSYSIAKFSSYGNLLWSSAALGTSSNYLAVDKSSNLYIAESYSNVYGTISTSGAYQSKTGGEEDFYLAKVKYYPYDAGIQSVVSPTSQYCQGKTPVTVNLSNFGVQELDSVNINWSINDTLQKVFKWKGKIEKDSAVHVTIDTINRPPGSFQIYAWTTSPDGNLDSFSRNDSSGLASSVNPTPKPNAGGNQTICQGASKTIGVSSVSGNSYSWVSKPSGFTSTSANPTVEPTSNTTYYLTQTLNSTHCSNLDSATITVNPLPAASVISNTAICIGNSISIGASAVTGSTYSWSNTVSGFSSTSSNPSVSPTSTSSYTLTETNTKGCVKSNSVTITVNPLPAASVISNTAICTGNSISIGASAVTGSTYSWASSVSGFSSTATNPSVSPTSTSSYTLTETNSNGCVKSNSVTITVNPLPAASVISNTAICIGNSISIGAAPVSGSNYSWASSVSGFSSTAANPSVSPTSTSSYTLTETNSNGCIKSNSVTITINPLPSASVISNTAICIGNSISIGAAPVSGSSYSWASSVSGFSSTAANPSVSPTSTSSYTLTETNANGCVNSNSVTITVNPLPAASVISNTAICFGNSISIGATSVSGSSYSWASSISGFSSTSSNPSVSPTSTSTYTLTETNSNGCVKSNSVTITVNPLPAASVISNTAICAGNSISIGASPVSGSTYSWTSSISGFSSTLANPSVSPSSTSTYTLTETNSNGCVKSNSVTITVNSLPAASVITSTAICIGNSILIGANAVSGSSYSWTNSISGYTSTNSNPSVSPTSTSSYTLTETNSNGCVKSNSVTITVNPLPTASVISSTAICIGNSISIGSSAVSGSSYLWISSITGYNSTNSNPSISPTSTSSYTLTETNSNGCVKSSSVTITVNLLPVPSFSINSGGQCLSANAFVFTDKSTISSGSISSWAWNFGDGKTSGSQSPTHSYNNSGTYNIKLVAMSNYGCVDSATNAITVYPQPKDSFIVNKSHQCYAVNDFLFLDKSSVSSGSISTWNWSFGDGKTSASQNPAYSYSSAGNYIAKSVITSNNGCKDSMSDSVTIYGQPVASFSINYPGQCLDGNNFAFSSNTIQGSWLWNFGDGNSTTGQTPSHTYTSAGAFSVKQIIISSEGCSDSLTKSVTVYPQANASFSVNNAIQCLTGNNFVFTDKTSVSPGNIASWNWDFGDKNSSSSQNPDHSYTNAGIYKGVLTTTTNNGCVDTVSQYLIVNAMPVANAGNAATICFGGSANIGSKAISGNTYSWSSDPSGYSSTTSNPTVYPTQTTDYYMKETITATGCSKTDSVLINVNPLPMAYTGMNTTICPGTGLYLGADSVSGDNYSWQSSPAGFSSAISNPTVKPSASQTYILTETIRATGCSKTDSTTITIDTACKGYLTVEMDSSMNTFDTLKVEVMVHNAKDVYSLYARLQINPNIFKLVSSQPGAFLGTNVISSPAIENSGYIDFGITKTGTQSGSTGTGLFYTFWLVVEDSFPKTDVMSYFSQDSIIAYNHDGSHINLYDSATKSVDVHARVFVWPGDLNNDRKVDVSDILPIGYFYNTTGPKRPNASLNWSAQQAPFWGYDKSAPDKKGWAVFADADGNGIVGLADQAAIGLNLSKSYNKRFIYTPAKIPAANANAPTLTASFADTMILNTSLPKTVTIPINIGNATTPVKKLNGLAFNLLFNPVYIDPASVSFDYTNSFFGSENSDFIKQEDIDVSNGKIGLGITRFNDATLNGYGTVANLTFTIPASAPLGYFVLTASVIQAADSNGNNINVNSSADSVHIAHNSGINANISSTNFNLTVFPNPFHTSATISYNLPDNRIIRLSLYDLNGKLISIIEDQKQMKGNYQLDIDAEKYHLNPGVYLLKFMAGDAIENKRVVLY